MRAEFLLKIELNIIYRKKAYLLSDLLKDWSSLCEDRGITSPVSQSHHLKEVIVEKFPESIGFFRSGKYLIVVPHDLFSPKP